MLPEGDIFGIPVRTRLPVLRSNALGGGSVARVADGRLTLGPESMGAAPGPACYGLGGREATLTDALVVLGILSPSAFLDGRRVLDVERARAALIERVGSALGLDHEGAALGIRAAAVDMLAALARETVAAAGWPDPAACELFAYGGNGPLFGTAVAERLGIACVRFFALGTVFSAYGSAVSDLLHVYERALEPGRAALAAAGAALHAEAARDLAGEGFDPAAARYRWQLEGGALRREAEGDPAAAIAVLAGGDGEAGLLRLEASIGLGTVARAPVATRPAPAVRGRRASPLATRGLPVYTHDDLAGHTLAGPCVVDGGSFTWLVDAGWRLAVDGCGDGILTRGDAP
jgi:acetophenone carboxylase